MGLFDTKEIDYDANALTEVEKTLILERVRSFMSSNPFQIHEDRKGKLYARANRTTLRASFALIIVILVTRFGSAADAAVPGDALYSLKIHVLEVIHSSMVISDSDRVAWESHRLQRRLEEVHELAQRNKLDRATVPTIIDTIESQVQTVESAVDAVTKQGNPESTVAIRQRLVRTIREREREFQRLTNRKDIHEDVKLLIYRLREARLHLLQGDIGGRGDHFIQN